MATRKQFDHWLLDFMSYFPHLESYLNNLSDRVKTQDGWFKTLQPFEQVILAQVTDRMLDGKIEPLEACDYGLFAIRIRAYAARIADDMGKAKCRKRARDESDEQEKFSGAAREAMVACGDLFVHSRAAIRVCRSLKFDAKWEDELNMAVITLHDSPTEAERTRCLQVIHNYGLTPEQFTPTVEDYSGSLLQSVPLEEAVA